MISVRLASTDDARILTKILNPIIQRGGTTAHEDDLTVEAMTIRLNSLKHPSFCHVAEVDDELVGYQFCQRTERLPDEIGDVASFVALREVGRGVGSALAEATIALARENGFTELNATIRADNESGMTYYDSIGFLDHSLDPDRPLKDGSPVDRISKRYSLT